MSNKLRIVVVVLVLIVLSGLGYLLLSSGADEPENSPVTKEQDTTSPKQEKENIQKQEPGKYVDYSADIVTGTEGKRILFFHAPWCPQCRQLDASIKSGEIPADVTIFKVDYDSNQNLRQQYGVTIQTTLVLLDENGNEAKKYVAYDQPSLEAIIKNLL